MKYLKLKKQILYSIFPTVYYFTGYNMKTLEAKNSHKTNNLKVKMRVIEVSTDIFSDITFFKVCSCFNKIMQYDFFSYFSICFF